MAVNYNTKIPTNGLQILLDSTNSKSYSGTGTTWYDISGNNLNATLLNCTYTTYNGLPVIKTNGASNSYVTTGLGNVATTDTTIIGIARQLKLVQSGRIFTSLSNNWLMGWWGGRADVYYSEGWVSYPGVYADTNWHMYTSLNNYSGDSWTLYNNGTNYVYGSNAGSQGPNGITIGGGGVYSGEFSDCHVSIFMVYNRILSLDEINTIYYAYKGRYSI